MRKIFLSCFAIMLAAAGAMLVPASPGVATDTGQAASYLVLYADGASLQAGRAAIKAAGGVVTVENKQIGLAEVTSASSTFMRDVRADDAVKGAARDRSVATARPGMAPKFADPALEPARTAGKSHSSTTAVVPTPGTDALTGYQWDMRMIGTQNADGSPALDERGDGVLVGIIDTGIDGSHPDIAPNFSSTLSRNFTTDMPDIDGPCE